MTPRSVSRITANQREYARANSTALLGYIVASPSSLPKLSIPNRRMLKNH